MGADATGCLHWRNVLANTNGFVNGTANGASVWKPPAHVHYVSPPHAGMFSILCVCLHHANMPVSPDADELVDTDSSDDD